MDKEIPKCPKGMTKFNRTAQICVDCRLGGELSDNKLGHYECPVGLEEDDRYEDLEGEGD